MAMTKLFVLLATLAVAASAPSVTAEAQLSAASGSGSSAIPLCNQEQLVALGSILKNTPRKTQCEATLKIKEMLTPPDSNFKLLCDRTSCTVALSILYNTLPQCRYKDWSPQEQADKVLRFCGVTPLNTTAIAQLGSGSLGDAVPTAAPTPVATWGSQTTANASFAPVGATSAPAAAAQTATPAPTTSAASTHSALAPALVLATSALAALWA